MTVDEIRELIALAGETGVAELEVQRGDNRVRIRRAQFAAPQEIVVAPPAYASAPYQAAPATLAPAAVPTPPADAAKPEKPAADPNLVLVKSPIVGTFYRSPEPGASSFVEVGASVKKGQVLCIIEAMKLMNEIDSEYDGEIVNIYVENGQPVQYGERLFAIRTA